MRQALLLALTLLATSSHAFLAPLPAATATRARSAGAMHMSGVERNPNFGKLVGGYVYLFKVWCQCARTVRSKNRLDLFSTSHSLRAHKVFRLSEFFIFRTLLALSFSNFTNVVTISPASVPCSSLPPTHFSAPPPSPPFPIPSPSATYSLRSAADAPRFWRQTRPLRSSPWASATRPSRSLPTSCRASWRGLHGSARPRATPGKKRGIEGREGWVGKIGGRE